MSLPQESEAPPLGIFHWQAEGLASETFSDVFRDVVNKATRMSFVASGSSSEPTMTLLLDETTLEIRVRKGKARDIIRPGKGCWKAALVLFAIGKHFAVSVVDDEANIVSVRSLKRQTILGFTVEEFDDFAERLGLINREMAKAVAASHFF